MSFIVRFLIALPAVVTASTAWADCAAAPAALDLAGTGATLTCLSGGGTITNSSATGAVLTVTPGASDGSVYSGTISGKLGLVKSGSGTLTLTGTGTYNGPTGLTDTATNGYYGPNAFSTAVTGGTLVLGSSTAIGTGGLIVDSAKVTSGMGGGGTLELSNKIMIGLTPGATGTFDTSTGDIRLTGSVWGYKRVPTNEFSRDEVQLIKTGSGTLFLDGYNYYKGGTVVEAGTLEINSDRSLGFGGTTNLTMWGGSTLRTSDTFALTSDSGSILLTCISSCAGPVTISPDSGTELTISAALVGSADLRKAGAGKLILTNDNSAFTGSTEIAAGVLEIQSVTALGAGLSALSSSLAIGDGGTLRTNLGVSGGVDLTLAPSRFTISGTATIDTTSSTVDVTTAITDGVGGAGKLVKAGDGTLILSTAATHTGGTVVSQGTLRLGVVDALASTGAVVVASAGTLDLGGHDLTIAGLSGAGIVTAGSGASTLTLAQAAAAHDVFSGTLSGALSLTKTGAGTLVLSGSNTQTGATKVLGGTLEIDSAGALSAASALSLANGTTLAFSGVTSSFSTAIALSGAVTISSGAGTVTLSTGLTDGTGGAGSLIKTGTGTLILAAPSTLTGSTTISQGTLRLGAANALPAAGAVVVASGGTLDLSGFGQTLSDLTGTGNVTNSGPAATLTLTQASGATDTFGGTLSGALSLTKTGTGTLVLAGVSTYSGSTTISQGTVRLGTTNALPTAGAVVVASGGTLDLSGNAQSLTNLTGTGGVTNSGAAATLTLTQASGASDTFAGNLSGALGLTKAGAGTLVLSGSNTQTGTTRVLAGTLEIDSAAALSANSRLALDDGTKLAFSGVSGTFSTAIDLTGVADPIIDTGTGAITLTQGIGGAGALTKIGTGSLILTGTSSYTGSTAVSLGTLEVGGSIASSPLTTVSSGSSALAAVLTGTGSVGGLSVDYGTVKPGSTVTPTGTLTALGTVTFTSNSTLVITVGSSGASKLASTGAATLAGTVSATLASGASAPTAGTRYAILTATGGISGRFGGLLTYGFSGGATSLVYDANGVYLQFGSDSTPTPTTPVAPVTPYGAIVAGSVTQLVQDRQGQIVTGRILGSVLLGANEQISCASACISAFGSVGSFQAGAHGRAALTDEVSVIGGLAWTAWDSGGARAESAPMLALALRWDPDGFGASRPYAEAGLTTTPWARSRYTRGYDIDGVHYSGQGSADTSSLGVFAKLGWVARLAPTDEVAASVEVWRGWMRTGAYAETAGADNPLPGTFAAALDRMNIAKVGGQWTHLWGRQIETQVNLGVATSFGSQSGVRADFTDYGAFGGAVREATWGEYGLRVGWRVNSSLVADVFADGTIGPKPVGNTLHGGIGLRHAF